MIILLLLRCTRVHSFNSQLPGWPCKSVPEYQNSLDFIAARDNGVVVVTDHPIPA